MSDDPSKPADPDDRIDLRRQAADPDHAAKIAGDLPPRPAPDMPVTPKRRGRAQPKAPVPSTGHEWDGITEYDNPMPRWWLWTFYATIVWAVGYMIAYPAIPLVTQATQGVIGGNARSQVAARIDSFAAANAPVREALVRTPLDRIPADPDLMGYATNAGAALYRTWCAQCHGAGAAGARGYPNLLDDVWLWGGTMEDIHLTLLHGIRDPADPDTRYSQMPRFGVDGLLDADRIEEVAHFSLSLSGAPHDPALAAPGAQVYAENCVACHGPAGEGDRSQGAPALNDQVWLYGSEPQIVARIIHDGPYGVMPAWSDRLTEAEIRALTVYVHGLGGGE